MDEEMPSPDSAVLKYLEVLHQFKLARAALTAMSRSLELEIFKFRERMQPVVLQRGIAKLPNVILGQIILDVVFRPDD